MVSRTHLFVAYDAEIMFSGIVTWVSSAGVFPVHLFVFKGRGMNTVKVYDILE